MKNAPDQTLTDVSSSADLLTVKEVAPALKMTPDAVRKLIYKGQLPAYYMSGRRIRVKRRDLDVFLQTRLRPVVTVGDAVGTSV